MVEKNGKGITPIYRLSGKKDPWKEWGSVPYVFVLPCPVVCFPFLRQDGALIVANAQASLVEAPVSARRADVIGVTQPARPSGSLARSPSSALLPFFRGGFPY